jgi:hypothetical protein
MQLGIIAQRFESFKYSYEMINRRDESQTQHEGRVFNMDPCQI